MGIREAHPVDSEVVDIRRPDAHGAVAANIAITKVINVKNDYIGRTGGPAFSCYHSVRLIGGVAGQKSLEDKCQQTKKYGSMEGHDLFIFSQKPLKLVNEDIEPYKN